jgi:hypothetical protein
MADIFDDMLATTPTDAPNFIDLIASETDRPGLLEFRLTLCRRAFRSGCSPRNWATLLDRRIADLYRGGADPAATTLSQLAELLDSKGR